MGALEADREAVTQVDYVTHQVSWDLFLVRKQTRWIVALELKNSKDPANTCKAPVTQDNRCKTTQVVSALISTQERARRIT